MAFWKINTTTFAENKLSNVTIQQVNMGVDRLTFRAAGRGIDADLVLSPGSAVVVYKDDAVVFRGNVSRIPIIGSGKDESQSYEIVGPWDLLERLVFQQEWAIGLQSKCILGQVIKTKPNESGTLTATVIPTDCGTVIREVINYAASCGVPIACGDINGGPTVPWEEIVDYSCAEVIRRMARWVPEAIGWVNYGQNGNTFNFRLPDALVVTTLAIPPLNQVSPIRATIRDINLSPVENRSVPAVVLKYHQTSTVNGVSKRVLIEDKAPATATGREIGAIVQTIELSGVTSSSQQLTQRQGIYSALMPDIAADVRLGWLIDKCKQFQDPMNPGALSPSISEFKIEKWNRTSKLPRELLEGSLQDWMRIRIPSTSGGTIVNPDAIYGFHDEQCTVMATVSYKVLDTTNPSEVTKKVLRVVTDEMISVSVTATDCPPGYYYRYSKQGPGENTGESPIMGLAEEILKAMNDSHYQGVVTLAEDEVAAATYMGFRILVSGGRPEWMTMMAQVQSCTRAIDSGYTTLQLGPPGHLSPGDVISLRMANRTRKSPSSSQLRTSTDPSIGGLGTIEIGSSVPRDKVSVFPGSYGVRKTAVTGIRYDPSSNQLQIKTQELVVNHAENESEWTVMSGGQLEACS